MKRNNFLIKTMIMFLALLLAVSTKAFAKPRCPALSITSDNPEQSYTKEEEIISSVEEIEMPLRQTNYGKYYDDFNRLVANELRPDAKKLFIEQEKAKEITNLKDAMMPLVKRGGFSERSYYDSYIWQDYEASSALNKYPVAFYDSLGRKISDDLIEDAAKLYEKQQRRKELSNWGSYSVSTIWHYIWATIKFIITIMIIFFAVSVFYKKVIKKV